MNRQFYVRAYLSALTIGFFFFSSSFRFLIATRGISGCRFSFPPGIDRSFRGILSKTFTRRFLFYDIRGADTRLRLVQSVFSHSTPRHWNLIKLSLGIRTRLRSIEM